MLYVSTRGQAPMLDFAGVLLAGLADDGGLYVPETWPHFAPQDWRALRGLPYPDLAARIIVFAVPRGAATGRRTVDAAGPVARSRPAASPSLSIKVRAMTTS